MLLRLSEAGELKDVSEGIAQQCDQKTLESFLLPAQSKSSRELHEAVKLHESDALCLTNLLKLSEGASHGQFARVNSVFLLTIKFNSLIIGYVRRTVIRYILL